MIQVNQNYTTTGEKALFDIHPAGKTTVRVTITGTATYDIDARIHSSSSVRDPLDGNSGLTASKTIVLDGPVSGVGLNITAITGSIDFEVLSVKF